jgi:hypothetical protein
MYLRVNLLGLGPRLMKKNLPHRGLTKVEKHCSKGNLADRSRYLSLLSPPFDSLNIDVLIRTIPKILV